MTRVVTAGMTGGSRLRIAATLGLTVFLSLGVVVPLGAVLREGWGFEGFWELRGLAARTVGQAALSAVLAAAMGLLAALSLGRRVRPGVAWLFPYSVPTVVAASVAVSILGRTGLLARMGWETEWLYSMRAVVGVHIFFNAPWVAARVARARREIPAEQEEAARTLGAGRLQVFGRILWPQLRSSVLQGALQTYCLCAMSFVLVLLLGGGPPVDTLETALFARVRYGDLDLQGAAACALWEIGITLLPALALLATSRAPFRVRPSTGMHRQRHHGEPRRSGHVRGQVTYLFWSMIFLGPYLVLAAPTTWGSLITPEFWAEVRVPLGGSLLLAALTTVLTLAAAGASLLAPSRALRALGAVPAGASALVLGLGAWLAYGRWVDPFDGSLGLTALILATISFPFASRWLYPVASGHQRAALEAARTLGASPGRAWCRVEWPRYRGPITAVGALVFVGALGESSAAQLFAGGNFTPVSAVLARAVAQYRFEQAQAVALLLLLVSALALWISSRGDVS